MPEQVGESDKQLTKVQICQPSNTLSVTRAVRWYRSGHELADGWIEQEQREQQRHKRKARAKSVSELTAAGERVGARHRVRRPHLRVNDDPGDAAVEGVRVLAVVRGVQLRPGVAVGPVKLVCGVGLKTFFFFRATV